MAESRGRWLALVALAAALAVLAIWWFDRTQRVSTTTSQPVAPQGEPQRAARTPELVPARPSPAPAQPGPAPTPVPQERAPRKLLGVVVEAQSRKPVAGAQVRIRGGQSDRYVDVTLASDDEGRFELAAKATELEVLVLGGGWVTHRLAEARHSGFNPLVVPMKSEGTTRHEVAVVRCGRVHGQVSDEKGEPAANARVKAIALRRHYDSLRQFVTVLEREFSTQTDDKGAYRIDALVPGLDHRIEAVHRKGIAHSAPFAVASGVDVEMDLALPLARWVRLRVEDASGKPVAGVAITLVHDDVSLRGVSDEAGDLSMGPIPAGAFELAIERGEWVAAAPLPASDATTGSATFTHTIVVTPALSVAGRVLGPDGEPVSGMSLDARQGSWWEEVKTEADGRFRIPFVPTGEIMLHVESDVSGPQRAGIPVTAGDQDVEIRLQAPPLPKLIVHVLDPEGRPVPFVGFSATTNAAGSGTDLASTPLELSPSRLPRQIVVFGPRDENKELLPFGPGRAGPVAPQTREITIRLVRGVAIAGRVVDAAGKPVKDVHFSAREVTDTHSIDNTATATSEADGRFRLVGLRQDADHTLYASPGDRFAPVPRQVVRSGTEDLVIRLERSQPMVLTVTTPKGRRVANAWVQVSRYGAYQGGLAHGRTNARGEMTIRGLSRSGRYALEVRPGKGWPLVRGIARAPWSPSESVVQLDPAWRLQGSVVDAQGHGVAQARVRAIDANGKPQSSVADAQGAFGLGNLPPGTVRLHAFMPAEAGGDPRASPWVSAVVGEEDVRLVLADTTTLEVVIQGWTKPPEDIQAALHAVEARGNWSPAAQTIDATGKATIRGVNPGGTYALYVHVGEGASSRVAWSDQIRGDAGTVRLTLQPAAQIAGRLLLPPGAKRPRVWIAERGVWTRARPNEGGEFVLYGLPPQGAFTLVCQAWDRQGRLRARVAVGAGRTDVEVRMER